MKPLSSFLAISLALAVTSQAANIILVTHTPQTGLIEFLEDGGNNTVSYGTFANIDTDSGELDLLRAADLIVVDRNTVSGDYANNADEIRLWTELDAPLWLGSSFLTGPTRWHWSSLGPVEDYTNDITPVSSAAANHPIFNGVTSDLDPGFSGHWKMPLANGGIDLIDGDDQLISSGTTLASRNNNDHKHVAIAEFESGALSGTGDAFGNTRLFLALPGNFENINPNAMPIYQNSLDYMLSPIPEPSIALLGGFSLLGFLRRRRV